MNKVSCAITPYMYGRYINYVTFPLRYHDNSDFQIQISFQKNITNDN